MRRIAERLDAEGHPIRTGKPWAPETVRYHVMTAMLLNELQKQSRDQEALRLDVAQQQQTLERQLQYTAELRAYNASLQERLDRIERTVEAAAAHPATQAVARR